MGGGLFGQRSLGRHEDVEAVNEHSASQEEQKGHCEELDGRSEVGRELQGRS